MNTYNITRTVTWHCMAEAEDDAMHCLIDNMDSFEEDKTTRVFDEFEVNKNEGL